jgi:hypothetical protein
MQRLAIDVPKPYIRGKLPHPECTSSKRGLNRCREDTLKSADTAVQGYLKANAVPNAHLHTPFMDDRFSYVYLGSFREPSSHTHSIFRRKLPRRA